MKNEIARKLNSLSKLKNCPKCFSVNLLHMAPDLLCLNCDWDSAAYYVNIGAMDNLRAAAGEHGFITRNHKQLIIESESLADSVVPSEPVAV